VDGRIFFDGSRQFSAIRTQDLPQLAKAICGFERGLVSVERCYKKQIAYIRLFAKEFEVIVLANDWAKILPYLSTGSPLLVGGTIYSTNSKDLSNLEQWDATFYNQVYSTLQTIFTESYPTSRL
jgi:hypothetical protein